jgi:cytochrome P450
MLQRHAEVVVERGSRMQEAWTDGQIVDAFALLEETTMAVMVEALFGANVDDPFGRMLGDDLSEAIDALERLPLPVVPGAARLPLPANRRFERAAARLDERLLPMIAARRTGRAGDGDILTEFARAMHPDGEAMDDRLVRDEAMSIFRGHKTTGTAVSWTWYLLSRHPQVEARMFDELDSVLGDALPSAEDLGRLTYTRMVLDESMRLFPPAWMVARRAIAEHEADGYVIPVGSTVVTSAYVIHRDERFHPEPRRFDPERFTPGRAASRHPFAYFPFGGGPKMCLGDEFAVMEAMLLLATVGRRWRLRLAPGHVVEPLPKATLKPRHGLRVILERRT